MFQDKGFHNGFLLYELLIALFLFVTGVMVISHFLSHLVSMHGFIEKRAQASMTLYREVQQCVARGDVLVAGGLALAIDKKNAVVQCSINVETLPSLIFTTWQIKENNGKFGRVLSEFELVSYEST